MGEDKYTKRKQQGIAIPNPYIVNPVKPFITDKYKNHMELNKIKSIKYFTKALLELLYQGFS